MIFYNKTGFSGDWISILILPSQLEKAYHGLKNQAAFIRKHYESMKLS